MLTDPPAPIVRRDHGADTLRGIAILMVLVLHGAAMTTGLAAYPWLAELANRLGSGVQLFFVLSGFVITAAMDRAKTNGDGAPGFLLRRLAKLTPLYLVFLHANIAFYLWWTTVDVTPSFFRNSVTSENLTWMNYGMHLLFLQGLSPTAVNSLVDGSWSVVCEVYFYTLVPLVIHRASRSLCSAWWSLAISVAVATVFTVTLGRHLGAFGIYAFPAQLPCFLMGVVVYRLRERFRYELPAREQNAILVTLGLLVFGFTRIESVPLGGHVMIAVFFALALLVIRVHSESGPLGWLQSIGRQSYALFLVHLLLLKMAYSMAFANGFDPGFWPSLAINLAISVGASIVLSSALFDPIDRFFVHAMARHLSRRPKPAL